MRCARKLLVGLVLSLALGVTPALAGEPWTATGPYGGDARSLVYDPQHPQHIFLGTSSGQLFVSYDGGSTWHGFAHIGSGDDLVLDHILIDPRNSNLMYVSAWSVTGQRSGGGVFRTLDGGRNWTELPGMRGESVRALAMSASDPDQVVAGALDGVFRSVDRGATWQRISPPHDAEIKYVESIAIDPRNPRIIYAGTWHLAWKTGDAGASWNPIHRGMIDDSDVFSIIIDRDNPSLLYASACSGIYKTETAGDLFYKVQGIPSAAQRTRALRQDPANPAVVYAGTTSGLWQSLDAGKTWVRRTDAGIIVNDVLVDPRDPAHVLVATDRGGVLASRDGGRTFAASNYGFAHRQVAAMLVSGSDPQTIYAGVVNDKQFGGVFVSHDGGRYWAQQSAGLDGRDVFALAEAADGSLLAGTSQGMYVWHADAGRWQPSNAVMSKMAASRYMRGRHGRLIAMSERAVRSTLDAPVFSLDISSGQWWAATADGLYRSVDSARTWQGGAVLGRKDFLAVRAQGTYVVAATHTAVLVSPDGGAHWRLANLPAAVLRLDALALTPDSAIWIATPEGAWRSADSGQNWRRVLDGLPAQSVDAITYDKNAGRLLAASSFFGQVLESDDLGRNWRVVSASRFRIAAMGWLQGRLLAATAFNGIVAQPAPERQVEVARKVQTLHPAPALPQPSVGLVERPAVTPTPLPSNARP